MVKYPDVTVALTGEDGNAFNIIGLVVYELTKVRGMEAVNEYVEAAYACESYDALLALTQETVHVT